MAERTILTMKGIVKQYQVGEEISTVLKGIDLEVKEGEFLAVLGPSGSGKSTLMNIIGCLDVPTSGEYILDGRRIGSQDETTLAKIRNREIGFIFQSFFLMQRQTALQNVKLPLIYADVPEREQNERAEEMLRRVGLYEKRNYYPNQLSGGQQQRVAIAGDSKTPDLNIFYANFYDAAGQLMDRQALYTRDPLSGNLLELEWYIPQGCVKIVLE